MCHNETINVWSHLIGSIVFIGMVFYVLVFLPPTSLHGEATGLVQRWTNDFDVGGYDDLHCDRSDWDYPDKDQCPYNVV